MATTMRNEVTDAELEALRDAVDNSIVADNITHVADFVVEKYEFTQGAPLPKTVRDAAIAEIRRSLWDFMERVRTVTRSSCVSCSLSPMRL